MEAKVARPPAHEYVEQTDVSGEVLFEVTCVVGAVVRGNGSLTPREAAFLLIARAGHGGTFLFPDEDGSMNHVTVEFEPHPK